METNELNESTAKVFEKIVEHRRSVRIFKNEIVPKEVIQKCMELSLLAPNSSNLQPWEIYRIVNEEKKKKFVECCFNQPAAATAPELFVFIARLDTWRENRNLMLEKFTEMEKIPGTRVPKSAWEYYQKLVPLAYAQGFLGLWGFIKKIIVNVMGLFKPTPREPVSFAQMRTWAVKSTALACENFMLAASSFGYDTCPMEGLDSARVKKLLHLPCDAQVVMGISLGKRDPKGIYGPRIRFDSKKFIHEV